MKGSKSTEIGRTSDTLHQQLLLNQLYPLKTGKEKKVIVVNVKELKLK